MSRYRFKKQLGRVGDTVDDFIDDAEDAWDNRGDIADDVADTLLSAGEYAMEYVQNRFRRDPVGTIAVGAIGIWVIGKLLKR